VAKYWEMSTGKSVVMIKVLFSKRCRSCERYKLERVGYICGKTKSYLTKKNYESHSVRGQRISE
jgi:hypothetical protein